MPVRVMLERKEDMLFVGSRHPFNGDYRVSVCITLCYAVLRCVKLLVQVGFTEEGRITTLDVELYSNGGASPDFSISVKRGRREGGRERKRKRERERERDNAYIVLIDNADGIGSSSKCI